MVRWKPDMGAAEVRARLDAFEREYGVPSSRLAEAFRDERGRLVESDEFHEWDELWTMWRHTAGSGATRTTAAG